VSRRLVFFVAFALAVAIIGNSWTDPHVVFSTENVWDAVLGIGYCMPLVMALAGVPIAIQWLRWALNGLLWPIAAIGTLLGAVFFLLAASTHWNCMPATVSTGHYTLAVFVFDMSAFDSGDVEVDQVCRVGPGVMYARSVWHASGTEVPHIDVDAQDRVRVAGDVVQLHPLIWRLC
jgi:hypothetical protein